jgi:hypothetical protein
LTNGYRHYAADGYAFNLSWHDWLNQKSLDRRTRDRDFAREDRGTFPRDIIHRRPEGSSYIVVIAGRPWRRCVAKLVHFTRVVPGQTIPRGCNRFERLNNAPAR